MLFNRRACVWVGRRAGRMGDGARPTESAGSCLRAASRRASPPARLRLRELCEDTGVINVHADGGAPGWFTYELPAT